MAPRRLPQQRWAPALFFCIPIHHIFSMVQIAHPHPFYTLPPRPTRSTPPPPPTTPLHHLGGRGRAPGGMRLWPRINTDRHGWRIAGCRSHAEQRTCFAVFAFIHVDPWQELLHQMNSTTAPPVIGDRQRLSATMVLSLLLHGMLILGVGFALDDAAPVLPTLDVILTQTQTELTPEQADFLAQANNQGGGEHDKTNRPREAQAGVVAQAAPARRSVV